MLSEYKIYFNYLSQKALTLKIIPVVFIIYFMAKEPPPNFMLVSGLICITTTFTVLEYLGNVFGLDYGAFYLHYSAIQPLGMILLKRVGMAISIQTILIIFLSVLLFFKVDIAAFRLHIILCSILVLQNFCTGCLFSVFFPTNIPKDIKNRLLRTHPGIGFSLNAAANFLVVICFYGMSQMLQETRAMNYYMIYIILLIVMIPVSIVIAVRQLKRNKYYKWQAFNRP